MYVYLVISARTFQPFLTDSNTYCMRLWNHNVWENNFIESISKAETKANLCVLVAVVNYAFALNLKFQFTAKYRICRSAYG